MGLHNFVRRLGINDVMALGLDSSNVIEKNVPILIEQEIKKRIIRVKKEVPV